MTASPFLPSAMSKSTKMDKQLLLAHATPHQRLLEHPPGTQKYDTTTGKRNFTQHHSPLRKRCHPQPWHQTRPCSFPPRLPFQPNITFHFAASSPTGPFQLIAPPDRLTGDQAPTKITPNKQKAICPCNNKTTLN
jgi:hypothetical protein